MLNGLHACHIQHRHRAVNQQREGGFRFGQLAQIAVGIPFRREHHAQRGNAFAQQRRRQFDRRLIAHIVIVEGNQDLLNAVLCKGLPVVSGDAVHAIGGGDIAVPRDPERHRIDERFTQDKRLGSTERRFIPDPGMFTRQIEMFCRTPTEIIADFTPVQLLHLPLIIDNRHNQRTAQVFMAVFPQHPDRLQPTADLCPRFHFFRWQTVSQRAVSKTQLELRD
ncbi:hypothetical protein Xmau_04561 [Xenorhabdus mauleonii]|uniref:Uncharacterized protein n=1 Tax=Xenorhabdus mauleonii TaxID=351675 RepID=A0A2G0NEF8_9GAMM|nr:hypothetical protein Xmau_04561 [Xenorhabdus mauleonii]